MLDCREISIGNVSILNNQLASLGIINFTVFICLGHQKKPNELIQLQSSSLNVTYTQTPATVFFSVITCSPENKHRKCVSCASFSQFLQSGIGKYPIFGVSKLS